MTAWRWKVTGIAESLDSYTGGTTLEELGERIAHQLNTQIPRDILSDYEERDLDGILDELREAYWARTEDFDHTLGEMYDWADAARIWIEPLA